jgi:chemotaxis protein methyltransferase CheR
MKVEDYEFISGFLSQSSGLSLGTGKEYLVEARLVPLAQSLGLADFNHLIRELRKGRDQQLSSAVTEAMTTNETSFFRDKTPFNELRERLLPKISAARSAQRKLRIWCAAASTGQEPYSIRMIIDDHFPSLRDWSIEIAATDISQSMLDRASTGIYTHFEVQRGLPIQLLVKHFDQVANGWQIKEPLRRSISWRKLNLLDDFGHLGHFDIVFCRNVLIYFDTATKRSILSRISRVLHRDGYLLLGAAETVLGICDEFTRDRSCSAAVYQRGKAPLVPARSA